MTNDEDVISKNLLRQLRLLESILQNPAAKHSFDVDVNADCSEKFHDLERLQRSLSQYCNRAGALTYIGFIGHFSSGKSTTLNSILDQKHSQGARLTGLNPTDKAVTLITHPQNSGSLIGMHRRGELEVGTSFQETELLKSLLQNFQH
jgi:ribosome biogenesis GTPase A